MAKTVKKEDIDEKAIIASFLQDEPTDHDALVRENEETGSRQPAPLVESPKEENKRKRGKEQDYETVFVKENRQLCKKRVFFQNVVARRAKL